MEMATAWARRREIKEVDLSYGIWIEILGR